VAQGLSVEVTFRARLSEAAAGQEAVENTVTVRDAFGREESRSAETQITE
jgi:hypothetical protein